MANPPVTCGSLTGQHMYMETGDSGTAGIATITIGPMIGTRTYQIKVTYLECSNLSKAPTDCVQYFTGVRGEFQSYNFQGGQLIKQSKLRDMHSQETVSSTKLRFYNI
ncbi:uncharacterized protein LOC131883519 [Tigriopus californicus]|uniref:uncharacterized protein LOC131883519 n=1 Tax=Tigriopus californicus TaxID=6832 RepID=UPI0027DA8C4F|nr:uncharacterized protein LOC131883519 [Tigriopus californicus]